MVFKDVVASGFSAGLTLLLFVSPIALAESACKGLASSPCSGKSGCVWVRGYTRKDNRKISGYCRAKGGKNANTGKAKTKKASSSRDSSSKFEQSSSQPKKASSSGNTKVTGKKSAKKSSDSKSKKKKTTSDKKSVGESKSGNSKTKTKTQKAKNAG